MSHMKKSFKVSLWIVLLFLMVSSMIIQAEETTPPQNASDVSKASEEMTVYVIRENAAFGALRKVWLACDEKVVASLSNGSYCCFKVNNGPNIINVVQAKVLVAKYLLKYTPGETVYLSLNYALGTFTHVKDIGKQLVEKSKEVPILSTSEPNDGYEISLMNPCIFDVQLMKQTEEMLTPDGENAVITFYRQGGPFRNILIGIWSEDEYLGTLKGLTSFQVKVKPGKHYFIAKSDQYAVVEANVEAGKNYYIEMKTGLGKFAMEVKLLPVSKETAENKLQKNLKGLASVTFDPSSLTDDLKVVMEKAKILIGENLEKVENNEIQAQKLLPEDGR